MPENRQAISEMRPKGALHAMNPARTPCYVMMARNMAAGFAPSRSPFPLHLKPRPLECCKKRALKSSRKKKLPSNHMSRASVPRRRVARALTFRNPSIVVVPRRPVGERGACEDGVVLQRKR